MLGEKPDDNSNTFRLFKKRLFHQLIAKILEPLRVGMTVPVVRMCPDEHYCQIIYDLGGYIADYPEQVLLTGIMSGWCPKWVSS